jgi:D-tyrosyl-tRNA(Tyr) deacylase
MRALLQRVSECSVTIHGVEKSAIGVGLLVLVGIEETDSMEDIDWLCGKISRLRIFPDESGVMNRSVVESHGELLVVSQFTLHASTKKGNRPSYIRAARPEVAIPLYEKFVEQLARESGLHVKTGVFGADMKVKLINDGPVTIWMDTKEKE